MATSAQQAELHALTWVCTLVKDRTAIIYTGSRYAFREAHDLGMLWKQHGFLTSSGNKILNGPYMDELLDVGLFYLPLLLLLRFWGILNFTLWKLEEIILPTFQQGMFPMKRPIEAKPLSWYKRMFSPNDNLEKLPREAQQLTSEKENKV